MNRFVLPLTLAFGLAAHSAFADVLLRQNVVVDADVVKLGDLFDNIGSKADQAIARAPAPGRRATLDADWLQRIAAMNGVQWHPQNLFEQTVIERAGAAITHDQIEAELVSALASQGIDQDSQIELSNRAAQLIVPTNVAQTIGVRDLFFDARNKRFTATIEVPANSPSASRLQVSGRVYRTMEIPVLSRPIGRGEVIQARDLNWTRLREDVVRRDVVTDAGQLVGMTPRQNLRSGQMISQSELQKPIAVERGALVTLVLKSGTMTLSAQGRAVEQGSIGDVIHVNNSQSNLTVEGRVEGPNTIVVSLNSATAMTN